MRILLENKNILGLRNIVKFCFTLIKLKIFILNILSIELYTDQTVEDISGCYTVILFIVIHLLML